MKIRDRILYLLEDRPQILIIAPIVFIVIIIIVTAVTLFITIHTPKKLAPMSQTPKTNQAAKPPAPQPSATLNSVSGVSLPEDPQ